MGLKLRLGVVKKVCHGVVGNNRKSLSPPYLEKSLYLTGYRRNNLTTWFVGCQ